ncbi:DUF4433 domain-containing protein [bacterium]|nr:DUF4433 domain-containing protein [bacterium]
MNRSEIREFHNLTLIQNVRSILQHGILSNQKVKSISHGSIAMSEVQDIRKNRSVPNSRPLHDYANLYFCARNPMMYKRKENHTNLCVLQVSIEVLDLPGVVITDGNAASESTAFFQAPEGLAHVDTDLVFAELWRDDDDIKYWDKKRIKCAEVLVPEQVAPQFIFGGLVSCTESKNILEKTAGFNLPITIQPYLFFQN